MYSHSSVRRVLARVKQMPQLSIMPKKTFCSSGVYLDQISASRSARLKRP